MSNANLGIIKNLIESLSEIDKRTLYQYLKGGVERHPLEKEWNINADYILTAIQLSADITRRGVRGIIAEATLGTDVISRLTQKDWKEIASTTDNPYDYCIEDSSGRIRIQVKNQRLQEGQPLTAKSRFKDDSYYIVETQKTRSGENKQGETTRAYRYGEFDILAVCLQPSTGNWKDFLFTVSDWLMPHEKNSNWIGVYQPVPPKPTTFWSDDIETAISWFRLSEKRRIWPPNGDKNQGNLFEPS